MSRTLAEIIASGDPLEVDILQVVPANSSRAGWAVPGWQGYRSVVAYPVVDKNSLPAGLAFRLNCQFLAKSGAWPIAAVAVSYQGSILFFAPLENPNYCTPQTPFPVEIHGLVNGVLA